MNPTQNDSIPPTGSDNRLFDSRIRWIKTADEYFPYEAEVNGCRLRLRVNDFPDEPLYTLIVEERVSESFDDFPPTWIRCK